MFPDARSIMKPLPADGRIAQNLLPPQGGGREGGAAQVSYEDRIVRTATPHPTPPPCGEREIGGASDRSDGCSSGRRAVPS